MTNPNRDNAGLQPGEVGTAQNTKPKSINKRRGRGKAKKSFDLINAAVHILEEIQPASVRAVCYRLFVGGYISDMSKKSTDSVGKQLVWARENGQLPWPWIVDETREAERVSTWDNPSQIIDAAVRGYRRNYWQEQPEWIEVWSEKGTIRGTLAPVLNKYGVTLRVMHGYGSATSLHDIAEETIQSDKPLTILYVGDWDPSGMNMSDVDIPKRLERYNGAATIKRIALDESDVGENTTLPSFDAGSKAGDSRYKDFVQKYGERCWELDALPPPILRQRVEQEIIKHLDAEAWDRACEVEKAETDSMQSFLATWKSISGLGGKYSQGGAA